MNSRFLLAAMMAVAPVDASLAAQFTRTPVRDGRDVLRLMHTAYAGRWYPGLAFVQRTTFVRPGGVRDTATWYESLKGPNLLRIDLGDPANGRGWILTAESSYTFRDGHLAQSAAVGNVFLPLIMGVYLQPPEVTARGAGVAWREVTRAATAWPTQPAYLWGRALMAARVADSAALRQALQDYAGLGLGRDLRADSTIARFLGGTGFAVIVAAHDRHRASLVRSRVRATLPDSSFWPEGMDHDPRTGHLYVTSIRHRTIAEYSGADRIRELWPRGQPGIGAMLGVRVDSRRGVLWATTSGIPQMAGYQPADSGIAALLRIRITDGTIERRWDLPPVTGGHVLGDLAVGPAGDVYLTDSQEPVLYRLRPGSDTLERITHPLFRSLQGLAPTPDGRAYLADYSHGLLRIDLASGRVTRLADPRGVTSLGCDGIVWYRGSIVAVQNGVTPARIMRFVLDAEGTRIVRAAVLDQNLAVADEPTIGALIGDDFVYVANSQWEKYGNDGRRHPGTILVPPVLLAVPLSP